MLSTRMMNSVGEVNRPQDMVATSHIAIEAAANKIAIRRTSR
jgi:hypothetical protein